MSENPPQKTVVMKFGGSSVGTPQAMLGAIDIIHQTQAEWPRVVVVVSALSGVTNLLLDGASQAALGNTDRLPETVEKLRSLHYAIIDELIEDLRAQAKADIDFLIDEFANLCHAISILGEATPRALDAVASLGERMSVRLLAPALCNTGTLAEYVETQHCIVTDNRFQNAHPDFAATTLKVRELILPILEAGKIPVVTGFIGATPDGIITTLGRDGSDFSAAIVGAVLPASEVWIWTDVNGVMSADPRVVPEARTIPTLSYRELSELVYFGGKKPHPKAIRPVVDAGVGLRICNTFNPSHPGTRLLIEKTAAGKKNGNEVLKAVSLIRSQRLVTVEGRGMLGVPGVAARTFAAVASTGTSVPLITQASSEQSICFSVPANVADGVIDALKKIFATELADHDIDRIWATDEVAIVTVVGEGMRETPGVAGRVFAALGESQLNVIAIAQGSSEVSISLVVASADAEASLKAIHQMIISQK
ncbi:MAG: aspartate kinase [Chloroflexota bacterium]